MQLKAFVESELGRRVLKVQQRLKQYVDSGKKVFLTSSFQTQSLPLLHIVSQLDFKIPVYFLDTGFLFPETYMFRDELIETLGLQVITLNPSLNKQMQIDKQNRFLFMTDPDKCCEANKVKPLEPILKTHDVWVSGVRHSQSRTRESFEEEARGKYGILRYHPLLRWTSKEVYYYAKYYRLPEHPLQEKGYFSIGCMPCTTTIAHSDDSLRQGRWSGMRKEECGLHTELMRVTTE